MKIEKFEDLEIWKLSIDLVKKIYELTREKEFAKDFSFKDQIRRAVISISSNIVEGFEKNNNNEFIHYLKIAKGSAGEVMNQLYIGKVLFYISDSQFQTMQEHLFILSRKIGAFIAYLQRKRNEKEFIQTR